MVMQRHSHLVPEEVPVSSLTFREIMGSFPTGVAVITTRSIEGRPVGLTANAVSSVSLDPPQLLVCIARSRYTARAIEDTGAFAVNFLSKSQQQLAELFASPAPDKFDGTKILEGKLGLPLIAGALAQAECKVTKAVDAGDHLIFIGLVHHGRAQRGVPLMFFRRNYGEWRSQEEQS